MDGAMTWEYRLEQIRTEDVLEEGSDTVLERVNRLGQEGWELVSCTPLDEYVTMLLLAFKRPQQGFG